MGDIAEVKAIKKVFSNTSHIKMNATKSLIGHCLGAASGVEAIATIKAIESGWVHPTLNQHNLIDEVAGIDTVPNEKKQHAVSDAMGGAMVMGDKGGIMEVGEGEEGEHLDEFVGVGGVVRCCG